MLVWRVCLRAGTARCAESEDAPEIAATDSIPSTGSIRGIVLDGFERVPAARLAGIAGARFFCAVVAHCRDRNFQETSSIWYSGAARRQVKLSWLARVLMWGGSAQARVAVTYAIGSCRRLVEWCQGPGRHSTRSGVDGLVLSGARRGR